MEQEPNIVSSNTPPQEPGSFVRKPLGEAPATILPPQTAARLKPTSGFKGFYRENRFYFWAILVGVCVISVLSYFAFRKSPAVAPKEANVNISVDVPQTVPAGGEAVYSIKVDNQDNQKLVGMSLELAYADGVSYISSSPDADNLSGTLFAVPDLIPGQNAVVIVKARAAGNINDTKDLNLKLHYKYSNFNSEFIKQQTATVRLVASDIVLELSGPTTTNNAQLVVYNLKYQNNSQNVINNARVKLNYPDGFSFATATPVPDSGSDTWNISSLAPGALGNISISGTFSSANPGESKTATADFLVLGNCPDSGGYCKQGSSSFTTQLATLPLLVSQELANADSNNIVNPGDTLTFHLKYQNNASTAATAVNIVVTLNSNALDLGTLSAEGGQINNNVISWNASSVSNLESLNPSDSGQLTFSVRVKNPAIRDSSKNLTVVSGIKIKSNEYDTYFPGNSLTLKVASPMTLTSALAFVSGQLPPQVGKATVYQVTLSLANSTNDFNGGLLTAFIPLGAGGFVSGSVNGSEASKVLYDPATNKLTWQVGQLPAHTGQFSAPRALQFSVRIIPSASEAGEAPVLVKSIQFIATDTFTNQPVTETADDLSTSSTNSDNGINGTVQK
jgi:hypothetical protein